MKYLATLNLPGDTTANSTGNFTLNNPANFRTSLNNLGDIVSLLLTVAILAAGILTFIWFTWGAFQYIMAGGNKESLAKARSRIMWSLIGFVIVIMGFFVSQYTRQIFPDQDIKPQQVSSPLPGFDTEFNIGFQASFSNQKITCLTDPCKNGYDAGKIAPGTAYQP